MDDLKCKGPTGRSDHVVIEFMINERGPEEGREEHRHRRYKFSKAKVKELGQHFKNEDCTILLRQQYEWKRSGVYCRKFTMKG